MAPPKEFKEGIPFLSSSPALESKGATRIRRGTQARVPLKMAIIGGGKACDDLLTLLAEDQVSPLQIEILGVADRHADSPGLVHARRLGIFTTPDFRKLYDLPGLNFLIELTGSNQVREEVIKTKPLEASFMDHRGARLLWDLLQIEADRFQLKCEEVALVEEVRRHKEYLENILTHSSDMIITTDLEGRIVTFNPGGERMMGYSQEEVLGRTVEEFWKNPDDRKRLMEAVQSRGAVNNFQATLITKNGQPVEISLSLSLLRNRNGQVLGTVGISKDVTEENRLRRQLIENERLAAIGQTVAGLAHCIKNILNGLKGGAYLITMGLKRDKKELVEEGWETVQKGVARINNLSLDMLSYCRERAPEYHLVDPLQLARDTVEMVAQAAGQEGIQVVAEGKEGLSVRVDPTQIGRALLNLVGNAIDACREKVYPEGESPLVELTVDRQGEKVLFMVRDNGHGMDEEVQSWLFTRFFSTKESGGTGLGLPVTQKIVTEHGGLLKVESHPGRGTTFSLLFPIK